MGAARICSRCLVRLVTNAAHTRVWCPICKRQIRLEDHSEEKKGQNDAAAVACAKKKSQSAHAAHHHQQPPPLPPQEHPAIHPPPLPAEAPSHVTSEPPPACGPQPPAPKRSRRIVAIHRHLRRQPSAVLAAGACIGLMALIAAALGMFYLSGQPRREKEEGSAAAAAAVQPVAGKKKQDLTRPLTSPVKTERRITTSMPSPTAAYEMRKEKALRAVFQNEDAAASPRTSAVEGARRIDELVVARLKDKSIPLAPPCSDAVFVRRVYLDVIGRIPTGDEAKEFLASKDADRRAALIDALLAHRDFADYWAMKWCDLLRVKSEFPINLWPNAVQAYHRWIRASVRDNLPYDQFARALLTSSGSNFRDPPANFFRAVQKKDAANLARAVALTFMGVRPEGWPRERWAGMEAFFAQVGYKSTREWKEEVVFFDQSKTFTPEYAVFPDGTKPTAIEPGQDPREVFADWLITPKNPWFTRNIANRAWSWLLGRGIIHEVDDIRPDNPPSNPELLAHLEQELIRAKYDLRQLFRVILNSNTYQASSIPTSDHAEAVALFAFYPVRRLEAEVLIDAICQVTGTTEKYSSPIPEPFTYIPESHRSVALADASITSSFLEMFGRSSRDTGLESERNNNFTPAQRLHLLNSAHITQKIEKGPALQQLLTSGGKPEELAERLYLAILSRYPTQDEKAVMAEYRSGGEGRRPGLDIAWALMNTAEFLCRH